MAIMSYNVEAIGYVHIGVPSKKYQLPRQPDLENQSLKPVYVELLAHRDFEKALEGLSGFSHLWILFWMDRVKGYKPKVRPPGLDRKCGLFSTRSPHRPNPIGLSCVKLLAVEGRRLWIQGCDMLDKTPVLDIKPYLAHQESHPLARRGWLDEREPEALVDWQEGLYQELQEKSIEDNYLDPVAIERRLKIDSIPSHYNRLTIKGDSFEMASGKWRFKGLYQLEANGQKKFFIQKVEAALAN
jgi:tRNA-Thr(GGU) m(6)t(6)A37 methyltransferase TsaA